MAEIRNLYFGHKRSTRRYRILAITNKRLGTRNRYIQAAEIARKIRKSANNFRIKEEARGDEKYFLSKL